MSPSATKVCREGGAASTGLPPEKIVTLGARVPVPALQQRGLTPHHVCDGLWGRAHLEDVGRNDFKGLVYGLELGETCIEDSRQGD